ncbi:uncharacterized protein [Nerophis lumbriciformis]|uniref:uncharacterized protein isoform X1 n=1 Tax=Nerophis lumbriciformis TaxID=546530 RepID=UPI002AE09F55|nr:uncharacterized protein LOC133612628 isoform X1 [Nerophis lumbriciformis]
MQASFYPFLLIALHVSVPVDCKWRFQELHKNSLRSRRPADTPVRTHHYSAGFTKKHFLGDFLVILPVRTNGSDVVSIFDLRRKRFVCMDSKGDLYNSRQKESKDCLFYRIDFYSAPSGSQLPISSLESSHPSFLKRFLAPLVTRQRRSEEVNPSDPLRSESDPLRSEIHPTHSVQDHKESDHLQPEQPDQAGAVSKETISSCDDPLKVLHANGPVSPVKTIIEDQAEQE